MKRMLVFLILALSFVGLANAAYLAGTKISGAPLICNIQGLSDCNIVAESPYSSLLGIPVAFYGVGMYALLFILAAFELMLMSVLLRRTIQVVAAVDAAASIAFTFIQIYLIGALCAYCLFSAGISFLILIVASLIEPVRMKRPLPPPPVITPPPARHLPMPPQL